MLGHGRLDAGHPRLAAHASLKTSMAGTSRANTRYDPAMTSVNTIDCEEVTAIFYFFAGAILESAGLAASGLVSFLAASAGLSMRSTLAASRSLATYSACALRVT